MSADQRTGQPLGQSSLQRRSAARTAVVWDALRDVLDGTGAGTVLDIGGGTGELAVRVAELGHRVVVVDPSPDALAILARRADEHGVAGLVSGQQGDLDDLPALLADTGSDTGSDSGTTTSTGGVDAVLCHGVLEIVDDPAAALAVLAGVLRPGGTLSLLVNQRHAAVVARAMAGHFAQARALLDPSAGAVPEGPHRRFTAEEITAVLDEAGFDVGSVHAVRVFVDLVPSSLADLEPGAAQALVDLERAVSTRPEYLTLATQIHLLATRR
jgi:S-adenosylmethionine-dependent methyltransferase